MAAQLSLAVFLQGEGPEGQAGAAGPLCRVRVDRDGDVLDLKDEIEAASGIPAAQQRLYRDGHSVRDHADLSTVFGPGAGEADGGTPTAVQLVRLDPERAETFQRLERGELRLGGLGAAARADRELALAALWRAGAMLNDGVRQDAITHVAEALWADREVVLAAVACSGAALARAAAPLRGDRRVVLAAVAQDGMALRHAAPSMRSDREVVLAAVRRNGFVLELLPEALRGDKDVVLAALARSGTALQFVAEPLRRDWHVIAAAVKSDKDAMDIAPAELRGDVEFDRFMREHFQTAPRDPGAAADAQARLRVEGMWG